MVNLGCTTKILEKDVAHPNKHYNKLDYEKFCSFVVTFNSTHPTQMFNSPAYDIDAIVQDMLFL